MQTVILYQHQSGFNIQNLISIIAIYNGRSGLSSYREMHPRGRRRGPAPTKCHFMHCVITQGLAYAGRCSFIGNAPIGIITA